MPGEINSYYFKTSDVLFCVFRGSTLDNVSEV